MRGAIGSLNAAVAGSILLFAAVAQRGGEVPPPRAPAADRDADTDAAGSGTTGDVATALDAIPIASPATPARARKAKAEPAAAETEPDVEPVKAPRKTTVRARKPKEVAPAPAETPDPRAEAPEPAADDLLPGAATPASTRPRRARKGASADPDSA
jgi:hypothetical protein